MHSMSGARIKGSNTATTRRSFCRHCWVHEDSRAGDGQGHWHHLQRHLPWLHVHSAGPEPAGGHRSHPWHQQGAAQECLLAALQTKGGQAPAFIACAIKTSAASLHWGIFVDVQIALQEEVVEKVLLADQPSKEFVSVDDVGQFAVFLCSDAARQMTGACLSMDGGWTAR